MKRTRRRVVTMVAALAALTITVIGGLLVHAYRHYASVVRYTAVGGRLRVEAGQVRGIGTALVTDRGYAVYMYPPDGRQRVTCTDQCADAWPPLIVREGTSVIAGDGVEAGQLGTVPNPSGQQVVTYDGWPLYTYVGDSAPGQATGQALDLNGGYWYVLRPTGSIVKHGANTTRGTS